MFRSLYLLSIIDDERRVTRHIDSKCLVVHYEKKKRKVRVYRQNILKWGVNTYNNNNNNKYLYSAYYKNKKNK